jgi:D-glycero-alpha-D-manno-heptose 1-phosphate guanylyltransferase
MNGATPATSEATAVILAGGFGTRIRHLLDDVPKPMAPVAGRPFLEWVVRYFRTQGVRRFVLSTGYRAEVIARHFALQPVPGIEVVWVPETEPLGTAGGFLHAVTGSGFASSLWLVANGDSLALTALDRFMAGAAIEPVSAAILALAVPDTSRFGTLEVTSAGRLVRFAEKRPGAGLINAGVYAFKGETLDAFPKNRPLSFETEVFPSLLSGATGIAVQAVEAPFLDIGTPASLAEAERFIQTNLSYFSAIP